MNHERTVEIFLDLLRCALLHPFSLQLVLSPEQDDFNRLRHLFEQHTSWIVRSDLLGRLITSQVSPARVELLLRDPRGYDLDGRTADRVVILHAERVGIAEHRGFIVPVLRESQIQGERIERLKEWVTSAPLAPARKGQAE